MCQYLSLRTILGLIVGFMGVLGLLLALASGAVHERHAFHNQSQSMQKLIRLKTEDLLRDLTQKSTELGLNLQSETTFRDSFLQRDLPAVNQQLTSQFTRYFVTADVMRLEKLQVFDADFALLSEQSAEASWLLTREPRCPLIERARLRTGAERLKVVSGLCTADDRPYHAVLVPIGGLMVKGYLLVITDPADSLRPIETSLGMPLMLRLPGGQIVYRSAHWPPDPARNFFITEHILKTEEGQSALSIMVADDIRPLFGHLPQTRLIVMIAATLITVVALLLATAALRRTTLGPLRALNRQLHLLRRDRSHLGEQVQVGGGKEIRELSDNFNAMSQELGKLYQTLETMAYTDQLTELPNRNQFQQRLRGCMQMHQELRFPFALYLMDINRFKTVNDTLGHHIGDLLLREVGERIANALRGDDIVTRIERVDFAGMQEELIARLGGDEFAAILPNVLNAEDAMLAAQKVLAAMETPFIIEGHKLNTSVSIGIALFPSHSSENNELVRKADVAMYRAKKTRQGCAVYDAKFDMNNVRHLTLEQDLHVAVQQEQLFLHYQPKIDLVSGAITGVEALVRWNHPQFGEIPPDEFVPLAEQLGLIQNLTRWVLDRAISDRAELRAKGNATNISVNLSAVNLRDQNLVEEIESILRKSATPAGCVTLELTETAVMADPAHALTTLTRLRDMGLRLSIDDFGTGYSSLAYIKKLPVDEIKIDRSFVRDMLNDSSDEAIIRSILVLAHYTRLSVLAEGVESKEVYERLRDLGCDQVQGYFTGPPMSLADLTQWIARNARPVRCPNCCDEESATG